MMVMLRLEQRKEIKKEQFHSLHLEMTEKFLLNKMCLMRFSICCDRVYVVEDVEAILSP